MDFRRVSRRRLFVGAAVAASAGVPAFAAGEAPKMLTPGEVDEIRRLSAPVPFTFDLARFNAIVNRPAQHRQVVVATSFSGASAALSHVRHSLEAYADPLGFNAGKNGLQVAAVFYGGYSYAMSFDDGMYEKYPIASFVDRELHRGDSTYATVAKSLKRNLNAAAYSALVADHGVSFFLCNNALSGFAYEIVRAVTPAGTRVTRDQVVALRDEMVRHFLPGTMLVPAGVAALNAIQEARYTFLPE